MSVALLWVVSPNTEVFNFFGILDSSRFALGNRSSIRAKLGRKQKWKSCSLTTDVKYSSVGSSGLGSETKFPVLSSMVANPVGEIAVSSEQKVYDVVLKQAALVKKQLKSNGDLDVKPDIVLPGNLSLLSDAYDRCGEVCAEYAKTFYLGTLLMTPERRRAIWAIYGRILFRKNHLVILSTCPNSSSI